MDMKAIKKALLKGQIRITLLANKRMTKRGYTKSDLISCIWSGNIVETQFYSGKICVLVEGKDRDRLPIVVVVGRDTKDPASLSIVSVFPPINEKFNSVI